MGHSILKYWTVYGMFRVTEIVLDVLLESSHFLLLVKGLFLLLFVSPLTSGYLFVFGRVIQPFLIKREETIEKNVKAVVKHMKETIIHISFNTINAMKTESDQNGQSEDQFERKKVKAKVLMSSSNTMDSRDQRMDYGLQRRWSIESNSDIKQELRHLRETLDYFPFKQYQSDRSTDRHEPHGWRGSSYDINCYERILAGSEYSRRRTRPNDFQTQHRLRRYDNTSDVDTYKYYRNPQTYRRSMNDSLNYMPYSYEDHSNSSTYYLDDISQRENRYYYTRTFSSDNNDDDQQMNRFRRQRQNLEESYHLY